MTTDQKPSYGFLRQVREFMSKLKASGKLSEEDFAEAERLARASAGGLATAAKRKLAQDFSELSGSIFVNCAFAEPPSSINVLPKPGTYSHPVYGTINVTKERNQRFVDNFSSGIYQKRLPIDLEHETKLSGAAGWITGLQQEADGRVTAFVEWTDRGIDAIRSDRFKYFSPEWYNAWEQPITGKSFSDVLIGGALCTRPFFKEPALLPLVASEEGIQPVEEVQEPEVEDEDWELGELLDFSEQADDNDPIDTNEINDPEFAEWTGAQINDLPDKAFLYIQSGGQKDADGKTTPRSLRHFPVEGPDGKVDLPHLRNALARIPQADIPESVKKELTAKASKMLDDANKASQPDPGDVHVNKMLSPCPMCGQEHMSNQACPTGGKKMATVEELTAQIEELKGQIATLTEANKTAQTASETADQAAEQLRTRLAAMEASDRRRRFTDMVSGRGGEGDGLRWYGEADGHVTMMESLATAFGEDSEQFKNYVTMQQGQAKRLQESGLFKEIGASAAAAKETSGSDLEDAVKAKREADPKLSYAEAVAQVIADKPELYNEDRKAQDARIKRGE